MALSAGARLGPHEVLSLVGVGGMGEVYKGRDTRLDRTVAIKLLPAEVAERPDRRARFEVEARAISSLNHPHICTLFDVGDADGRPYLVMEYCPARRWTIALRAARCRSRTLCVVRCKSPTRSRARAPRPHRAPRSQTKQCDAHGVGRQAPRLWSRGGGPRSNRLARACRRSPSISGS